MNIEPIGNKVLIMRNEAEGVTSGGIIIPDTAQEKPVMGFVIAVGPGKMREDGSRSEMQVNEGDLVIYSGYAGTEVMIDDDEYIIIEENLIHVIVKD